MPTMALTTTDSAKKKLGANLFLTKHLASDDFFVFQVAEFMAELVSFWNN